MDAAGNIYIADTRNQLVRRVTPSGIITTVAGNGQAGFSGDGGPATSAAIVDPSGIAVDAAGNIYIGDAGNHRIRKVTSGGIITTVAGNGQGGSSGDGGPATSASLRFPFGVAVDAAGNIYIADRDNHRVRKVTAGGIITTLAGNGQFGFSGDGILATSTSLALPEGVAVDTAGNVYIADLNNWRIRKVTPAGIITTVAGSGAQGFAGDGGPATSAAFLFPSGVAVDGAGNIYVADSDGRLRRVVPSGIIGTIAGNRLFKFAGDGGPATSASLRETVDVAVDAAGNIYIVDHGATGRMRKVTAAGIISTVAGGGSAFPGDGGPATSADIRSGGAGGLGVDAAGNLYIADTYNGRVVRVTPAGILSTVANFLNGPVAVAVDAAGSIYIAENGNERIIKVVPGGIITTVAGNGQRGFSGDGGPATSASLNGPWGVAVDAAGNIYIADQFNYRIRKVTPGGIITTVAGNGQEGFSGDGGAATSASLGKPRRVAVDAAGNIYIADTNNHRIRRVTPGGSITTVAGNGQPGFSGDGGSATGASLRGPQGAAVDAAGNIYIADTDNDRIRKVLAPAPSFSAAPANLTFSALAGAPAIPAQQISVSSAATGLAFSAQASTQSGGGWLSVSPNSGSTPGVISVSVNVAGLAAGTYQGTVTVQAPLASPAMQTVSVQLTVQPAPAAQLAVEPSSFTFEVPAGSGNPSSQVLRINNAGSGTLSWTAQANTANGGNWLAVVPTSGSASPGLPGTVQVIANVGGLAAGVYTGSVQVASPNGTKTVAVTVLLSQMALTILLSQNGLLFTGVEGGATVPAQTFGVLNTGQGTLNWTARASTTSGSNWLSVSPASGSSTANSLTVPLVEVGVNVSGFKAGQYSGLVRISAPGASNSPQFVTVTLNILPAGSTPPVLVRPTGLIFVRQAGTSSPGSQTVRVATAATGTLEAVASPFTLKGGKWLEALPGNVAFSATEPRTVTIQPALGSLSPDNYFGFVPFGFSDGSSQTVNVLFVVTPAAGAAAGSRTLGTREADEAQSCAPQKLYAAVRSLASGFSVAVGWPGSIQVQVKDNCDNTIPKATVTATFSNGDPPLALVSLGNGTYENTWRPVNAASVIVTVRAESSPLAAAQTTVNGQVAGNTALAPAVSSGGIVHAASYAAGALAPGSIVSLFGRNLASGQNYASRLPLPTNLGDATLSAGDANLPLFYSSDGQINAQLPFELAPNSRVQVVARRTGAVAVPETITIAPTTPGIFTINQQGSGQGAILNARGQVVDSSAPASAGDVVQVFSTGLGATQPAVKSGEAAPAVEPLARVTTPVTATVGGQPARVLFAGLAPGFVGLYQVNVEIPAGILANPAVPLALLQNGVSSNTVTLAVR